MRAVPRELGVRALPQASGGPFAVDQLLLARFARWAGRRQTHPPQRWHSSHEYPGKNGTGRLVHGRAPFCTELAYTASL